jgi:hypothetical protein
MTIANLIRDYRNLKQLRSEYRRLSNKRRLYEILSAKLRDRIERIEDVTEIYLGVPICARSPGYVGSYRSSIHLKSVRSPYRHAEVYKKQNQKRFWGMTYRIFPGHDEDGVINYRTRNAALVAAKNFIAKGIKPKDTP